MVLGRILEEIGMSPGGANAVVTRRMEGGGYSHDFIGEISPMSNIVAEKHERYLDEGKERMIRTNLDEGFLLKGLKNAFNKVSRVFYRPEVLNLLEVKSYVNKEGNIVHVLPRGYGEQSEIRQIQEKNAENLETLMEHFPRYTNSSLKSPSLKTIRTQKYTMLLLAVPVPGRHGWRYELGTK